MKIANVLDDNDRLTALLVDEVNWSEDGCVEAVSGSIIQPGRDLNDLLDAGLLASCSKPDGPRITAHSHRLGPISPRARKVICVGLNYATHIQEMGRELPAAPTLFCKFADSLIGPYHGASVPEYAAGKLDWEGELAIVIGQKAWQVPQGQGANHIAGYCILNDFTMRDFQYRTTQWFQGKAFDACSGNGPWLESDSIVCGTLRTLVNGVVKQEARIEDLVFNPDSLVEYVSQMTVLRPGDIISTGTPGGVGHARHPQEYLNDGDEVLVAIEGLGAIRNKVCISKAQRII